MATITCKQCGYVNEGERIYCHNCGVKLERALIEEEKPDEVAVRKKEHRRIKRLVAPNRGAVLRTIRSLVNTLLWAVLAAVIVQMARTPDGVPPMPTEKILEAPQID